MAQSVHPVNGEQPLLTADESDVSPLEIREPASISLVQLCFQAEQDQDWAALERVWLEHNLAAFIGNAAVVHCFARIPVDARRRYPGLSEAFAALHAVSGTTPIDLDAMLRTLVREGRMHAGWADHELLEDAVRAGSLWLAAAGAYTAQSRGGGGGFDA